MMKRLLAVAIALILIAAGATSRVDAADGDYHIVPADPANGPATLRCRPVSDNDFHLCTVLMPPGETINPKVLVGDAARWHVYLEVMGGKNGRPARAALYVKPLTSSPDIETTIDIMSDQYDEPYRVLVIADPAAATFSEIHFDHNGGGAGGSMNSTRAALAAAAANAKAVQQESARLQRQAYARARLDEIDRSACAQQVDAHYNAPSGSGSFRPTRVFNDGRFTCFVMPANLSSFVLPYAGTALLHYTWRPADHVLYVQGVPTEIDLKDGTSTITVTHQ